MAVYYAQINNERVVIGIKQLSNKVNDPHSIEIIGYDESLLGQLYQDGVFIPLTHYAELDEVSTVTNVIGVASNVVQSLATNMVRLDQADYSLIGAKYADGKFIPITTRQDQLAVLNDKVNEILNYIKVNVCSSS
ncbi:MAG: hypothetical protein FWC91_13140 [Defluviitaleaceae bacterium]|nr:hypothetical protein [Defluviitaleaceae bacterium]